MADEIMTQEEFERLYNAVHAMPNGKRKLKPVVMIEPISFDGKSPDEIKYLLLLTYTFDAAEDADGYEKDWKVMVGRQFTFDELAEMIKNDIIFMDESYVISETATPMKAISVYRFMRHMYEQGMVISDFDVTEYRQKDPDDPDKPLMQLEHEIEE